MARMSDSDGVETETWLAQSDVEWSIMELEVGGGLPRRLRVEAHVRYLEDGLRELEGQYVSLDAAQPWLCYWMLHGLDLMHRPVTDEGRRSSVVSLLRGCKSHQGGFGGGPQQRPHLATTYAAVSALVILDALDEVVDRPALYRWIMSLKDRETGAFRVTDTGEMDVRGTYLALAAARLCNIVSDDMTAGIPGFLVSLQSFDGGLGAERGNESHGGYTYCGLAAAVLLEANVSLDLTRLAQWLVMRQSSLEGGFQGRTNKLVDSCYSFWQSASFPLVEALSGGTLSVPFSETELERYVVSYCQDRDPFPGGLWDKPGKLTDYYHTCYALAGLSVAQHRRAVHDPNYRATLAPVDPRYNIRIDRIDRLFANRGISTNLANQPNPDLQGHG